MGSYVEVRNPFALVVDIPLDTDSSLSGVVARALTNLANYFVGIFGGFNTWIGQNTFTSSNGNPAVTAQALVGSAPGVAGTGSGSGPGGQFSGGATGAGVTAAGGATSGDAIDANGGANARSVNAINSSTTLPSITAQNTSSGPGLVAESVSGPSLVVNGNVTRGMIAATNQQGSDPSTPVEGDMYYNNTTHTWRFYNGSVWGTV